MNILRLGMGFDDVVGVLCAFSDRSSLDWFCVPKPRSPLPSLIHWGSFMNQAKGMDMAHMTPLIASITWNPILVASIESNGGKTIDPIAPPQNVIPAYFHLISQLENVLSQWRIITIEGIRCVIYDYRGNRKVRLELNDTQINSLRNASDSQAIYELTNYLLRREICRNIVSWGC